MALSASSLPEESSPALPHQAFRTGNVYEVRGWRRGLAWVASLLLRLYYASLRWQLDAPSAQTLSESTSPRLVLIWHNRSLVGPGMLRHSLDVSRLRCLVSPSRQAAWEAAAFAFLGLHSIRGSSTRRSIPATREMLATLRQGQDVVLSPDGPKGPLYEVKRGVLVLARRSGVPLLLMSADSTHAWRPHTWDRHFVPLPFSRVHLRCRLILPADLVGMEEATALQTIRQAMQALTHEDFDKPLSSS